MDSKITNSSLPQYPLSSEHQSTLQMCNNVRIGLQNNVEISRIRNYLDWFQENFLEPHFSFEEHSIFPLLGNNLRVKKALANHRRVRKLLSCACDNEKVLNLLEEELSRYVRFEERFFLNELIPKLNSTILTPIEKQFEQFQIQKSFKEPWKDEFWKS